MSEKVLVLQGPVKSVGINFHSANLNKSPEARRSVWAEFDCAANITSLSQICRSLGYKIIYSGWDEDQKWLALNQQLFDGVTVSDQSKLPDSVEFKGRLIQNNKEKLYYSSLAGLMEAKKHVAGDSLVIRLRSDVAVDIYRLEQSLALLDQHPKAIFIEYADLNNTYYVPDIITMGRLDAHSLLYESLLRVCQLHGGYHISSHIDLGIQLSKMLASNDLSHVLCMPQHIHDTMVWRGIPRYYIPSSTDTAEKLVFDCVVNYPPAHQLETTLKNMPVDLMGKRGQFESRLH